MVRKSEKQFIEMGQSYYDHAAQYNHLIYRKPTAVSDVLDKLAQGFQDYQHILHTVRREYFQVIEKMKHAPGEFSIQVPGETQTPDHEKMVKEKQDAFLDLYGAWLASKSKDLIPQMVRLVEEIKALDPNFGFDIHLIYPSNQSSKGREE